MIKLRPGSSPDEVNDFQAVAVLYHSFLPTASWDDFAIAFDGNPVGLHSHFFNERGEGKRFCEFALLSIDLNFHCVPKIQEPCP